MRKTAEISINYGKLDDVELPLIVYKYRTWHDLFHKRFLTDREIFLASPSTFEDELDCHNPTRFDLLSKKQIYDYFLWSSKNDNPNFSRQQHRRFSRDWAKSSDINYPEKVKKFMNDSVEQYYQHEGILSLTENWNNDQMWNKYADNEKGICIGYDTKIMFKFLGGGGEVEYCDELPIVMPEPFMHYAEAMRNRVYFKLKKWEFEEEYRTKKFYPNIATIKDRQIQLPQNAFKKIILGNNISENDKLEIITIVKDQIGDIEIVYRKNVT